MMECTANDNTSEEPCMRSEVEVEHNTLDGNANVHVGETDLNVGNPVRMPSSESQQPASVDPYVGMEFDSDEAAKSFYNGYARCVGFSIRTSLRRRSRRDGTTIGMEFVCYKEGFRRKKCKSTRPHTREGCKAMIKVKKLDSGKWVVVKLVKEHNHAMATPTEVSLLRSHRCGSDESTRSNHIASPLRDCTSYIKMLRKRTLGRDADTHEAEIDEVVENPVGNASIESEESANLEPYVGMEFESEEAMTILYCEYARRAGFSIRTNLRRRSRRDGTTIGLEFVCSKEGFRRKKCKSNRRPTREGCKQMIKVKKQDSGKWVVTKFLKDHNHALVTTGKAPLFQCHKVIPSQSGGSSNMSITLQDRKNHSQNFRKRIFGRDAQDVLEYFKHMQAKNASFIYAIKVDNEHHMTNFFWVDARSRMAYYCFGDVVTFDTTYGIDQCGIPLVLFMGVNHHKQPVLFGCALLLDETEASFVWLFNTWLETMSGRQPISFLSNQDPVIEAAIAKTMLKTCHHFSKKDILRKFPDKLGHMENKKEDFVRDFSDCIGFTELHDEFELCWRSLIDKYELKENEWFQSLYRNRERWVHVYLQETSFANMGTIQQTESMNPFFDDYVNPQTPLQLLVSHCEKSIDCQYELELKEDLKANYMKPVMKTGLAMESQAAEIYTRTIFLEFQEQLFQSLHHTAEIIKEDGSVTTLRVIEFGVEKREYTVTFRDSEAKASCSCQMFEYAGILCRHVLRVFSMKNVMALPSHYVLKRWAKHATSGVAFDEKDIGISGDCQESWASRYNDLSLQAIKYAGEAATSLNIYSVAMHALQKAFEEIDSAKKDDGMVTQPSIPVFGSIHSVNTCEGNSTDNTMSNITLCEPHHEKAKGRPATSLEHIGELQQKKKRKCQICQHPDHDKRKCPHLRGAGTTGNSAGGALENMHLHGGIAGEQFGFSDKFQVFPMNDNHFLRYV
eukprot:TRINITY_DN4784_c0_g3_i1.p1 TRINITY_DN4784_c0_g3~~TRINITY_DN4784_c0_g3_i1.p1  ORF type:complete len:958 (-),score=147.45 TRINITY_DN4784_c0_g3_i1:597-3470(-)